MQDDTDPADYFDQGNGTNNAGAKVGHPTHALGEHIDGLQKTNGPTESEDENENDLSRWLKVGNSGEKKRSGRFREQACAQVRDDQTATKQGAGREHSGKRAFQAIMGDEGRDHEHSDPDGTKVYYFQAIV